MAHQSRMIVCMQCDISQIIFSQIEVEIMNHKIFDILYIILLVISNYTFVIFIVTKTAYISAICTGFNTGIYGFPYMLKTSSIVCAVCRGVEIVSQLPNILIYFHHSCLAPHILCIQSSFGQCPA